DCSEPSRLWCRSPSHRSANTHCDVKPCYHSHEFGASTNTVRVEKAMNRWLAGLGAPVMWFAIGVAADPGASAGGSVERGREAVRGRPALNPPLGSVEAYDGLWKQWGLPEKPADYPLAIRERYG